MPYEVKGDLHCWIWTGTLNENSIPVIRTADGHTTARRYYWEREHGRPVPEGMVLVAQCGEKHCIRPYHAVPVTPAEKAARTLKVKVTPAVKRRMRVLLEEGGLSQREVARLMGVDEKTVRNHRKREFA